MDAKALRVILVQLGFDSRKNERRSPSGRSGGGYGGGDLVAVVAVAVIIAVVVFTVVIVFERDRMKVRSAELEEAKYVIKRTGVLDFRLTLFRPFALL